LGAASSKRLNQLLMDRNAQMRAVVSSFMPAEQRRHYMSSLNADQKIEMLKEASRLQLIEKQELTQYESQLVEKLGEENESEKVALSSTLTKIVDSLAFAESCLFLKDLEGDVLHEYRTTQPSLAFLHLWTDQALKNLLTKTPND